MEETEIWDESVTLQSLRMKMREFSSKRQWDTFHTPRNLMLALVGEIGELAEIFQWTGECEPGLPEFDESKKVHLSEELSDVLLYLVRLSDRCGVNLADAVEKKMEKNAAKYPADKCAGKSDKYTAYSGE